MTTGSDKQNVLAYDCKYFSYPLVLLHTLDDIVSCPWDVYSDG